MGTRKVGLIMEEKERYFMNITPLTVMEVGKLLDWLTENGDYLAQINNLNMRYKGIIEDTINGKREVFYIERKIK